MRSTLYELVETLSIHSPNRVSGTDSLLVVSIYLLLYPSFSAMMRELCSCSSAKPGLAPSPNSNCTMTSLLFDAAQEKGVCPSSLLELMSTA